MTLLESKLKLEKCRERMYKAIEKYGRTSKQAIVASVMLDRELNRYNKQFGSYCS